ncbi:MAG: ribonuclease Z [Epulopiscium sp. Nele67-Bin005]|nr:MAG: ribonuclease Z [Epulopiscium sp. Nele67-Bin005]
MLDICLLGTGGMLPLPDRFLTAMLARHNGKKLLIDCGEGTQVTMKMLGWGYKTLDIICLTHYHGDHVTGLPGLLLTLGNAGREEPLTIIGPQGLKRVVDGLTVVCRDIPFKLELIELPMQKHQLQVGDFHISAIPVKHKVPCFGYVIEIKRNPKFLPEKALELNIPQKIWKNLQHGETVVLDNQTYTPDMVLGGARDGLKVGYVTDARPSQDIVMAIENADLFICEGMYLEEEYLEQVQKYKHMLGSEAAQMAKEANCKKLWLTHFSPAIPNNALNITSIKKVFENSELGEERKQCLLEFQD